MAQFATIIVCFLLGLLLKRTRRFPKETADVLGSFVITISLPALVIVHTHEIAAQSHSGIQYILPILMPWLVFGFSVLAFTLLGSFMRWNRTTLGALILTAGLGNTSFVGFPLIEAIYGPDALGTAVLIDQPGTFLVLSTLGVWIAQSYGNHARSFSSTIKKITSFPPFISLLIAVALIPFDFPSWVTGLLNHLGDTLVPLALFSVGFQLEWNREKWKPVQLPIALGLIFKLFIAPLLIFGIYVGILKQRGPFIGTTLLEAAMAPMITGAMVAIQSGLNKELSSLMLAVGIPLSLISVPFWAWVFSEVAK